MQKSKQDSEADRVRAQLHDLRAMLERLPPLSTPADPAFISCIVPLSAGAGWHFAIVAADATSFPFRCRAAKTRSSLNLTQAGIWSAYRIAAFTDNTDGSLRVGIVEDTEAPDRVYLLREEKKDEVVSVLH